MTEHVLLGVGLTLLVWGVLSGLVAAATEDSRDWWQKAAWFGLGLILVAVPLLVGAGMLELSKPDKPALGSYMDGWQAGHSDAGHVAVGK